MDYKFLMDKAIEVSKNTYSPYSNFPVGACVLTENNKTYVGCNFENSSYGLTICAERNAVGSAIADGEKIIKAIAIYSPNLELCHPCGACRQWIHESARGYDTKIILSGKDEEICIYGINDILPYAFDLI